MNTSQLAAQLYTVREYTQTADALAGALARIRAIGYEAVQVSAIGEIPVGDVQRMLQAEGLTCCSTHEPGTDLLNNPVHVAERLKTLGCGNVAYPHPGSTPLHSMNEVQAFADALEQSGSVLRKYGITLAYHNHHLEFRRIQGKPILEWLYELTEAADLQAELDTYWIQYGGADPVDWCTRMKGRLPVLHLKDFQIDDEQQIDFAEVGNGNLDWSRILPAAEASGCRWFVVEQDTCPGDPFDSLQQSFEYLKRAHCTS